VISIPKQLWQNMLDEFARHPRMLERIAYLDGVRWTDAAGEEHGVVTTVTIPNAALTRGNYRVSAESIAQAGRHLPAYGLVRLAQIHTHGDGWTDHSTTDNLNAYSRRPGAVSVVLPFHATHRPGPLDGGVHLRDTTGWRLLSASDAAELVRILPSDLNFRVGRRLWNWRNVPWKK
jgi:hypothetical protein